MHAKRRPGRPEKNVSRSRQCGRQLAAWLGGAALLLVAARQLLLAQPHQQQQPSSSSSSSSSVSTSSSTTSTSSSASSASGSSSPLYTAALSPRALAHLPREACPGCAAWQPPAFVVSAFHDSRHAYGHASRIQRNPSALPPLPAYVFGDDQPRGPRVTLVLGLRLEYEPADWPARALRCAFAVAGAPASQAPVTTEIRGLNVDLSIRPFAAGYGYCDPPLGAGGRVPPPGLLVTLVAHGGEAPARDALAWVPVEAMPVLSAAELAAYRAGQGDVAVCTAPLHGDGHAPWLPGWMAFHRLVGVSTVMVYGFNPGPAMLPLLRHYHSLGSLEAYEWVLPRAARSSEDPPCVRPFFHASSARDALDSGPCVHLSEDVRSDYVFDWHGQQMAIRDCMLRSVGRFRWVLVADFDEYVLPLQTPAGAGHTSLSGMVIAAARARGEPLAASYHVDGVMLCPGCAHQLHAAADGAPLPGAPALPVRRAPADGVPRECLVPAAGWSAVLWASTVALEDEGGPFLDRPKCLYDPIAVEQPSIHWAFAFNNLTSTAQASWLPRDRAIKLHLRAYDALQHGTLSQAMLAALRQKPLLRLDGVDPGGGSSSLLAHAECVACPSSVAANKVADFALCNMLGRQLLEAVSADVASMQQAGVFDAWPP